MTRGSVVSIHIAREKGAAPEPVSEVRAVPGRGLEGDRYFIGQGTFSQGRDSERDVTLIEQEAIDAIAAESQIVLAPGASRRNITTRGVALNHLVGREFRIGGVRARGVRLCEPCGHLEEITHDGLRQALLHRAGLRAVILSEGVIRTGDEVELVDVAAQAPAAGA